MSASPSLAELLERYSSAQQVRAGRALWYQGDVPEEACLVVSGRLRRIRVHGKDSQALGDAAKDSWLGLAELYLGLPCLTDLVAVEASTLRRFGRRNFFELLREPEFKDLVLGELAREHYLVHSALMPAGADEVVARAIAGMAGASAAGATGTIRLALTQSELAEAAGLARETVNRSLRRLEEAGLVETGRGEILVYDLGGLRGFGV